MKHSVALWFFIVVCLTHSFVNINMGIFPMAAQDKEVKERLPNITEAYLGWLECTIPIGVMIGSILTPLVLDKIGSKITVILGAFCSAICILPFALSRNLVLLSVSNIFSGIFLVSITETNHIYFEILDSMHVMK